MLVLKHMKIINKKASKRTKLHTKNCAGCGVEFGSYRSTVRSCSAVCKAIVTARSKVGEPRPVHCIDKICTVKLASGETAYFDELDRPLVEGRYWSKRVSRVGTMYAQASNGAQPITMHNLFVKTERGQKVDHIDGNGLNNRRANLRVCLHKQNTFNSVSRTGASKFKGVSKADKKWRAYIAVNRKQISLGRYETEAQAAEAYNKAAEKHFGKFSLLNDLSCPGRFLTPDQVTSMHHR